MKQKKNIDRLFQEKFKDFEVHPSDQVWQNIVDAKKKKEDRKIVPIWWRLGGVAAILLLLVTVGIALWNNTSNTSTTPELVESNQKESTNLSTDVESAKDVDPSISRETESALAIEKSTPDDESMSTQNEDTKEGNLLFGVDNTQGAVASQDKTKVDQQTANTERASQGYIDNTTNSTQSNTEDVAGANTTENNTNTNRTGDNTPQKRSDLIDSTIKIDKGIDDAAVAVTEQETVEDSETTDTEESSKKSLVEEAARIVDAATQDDDLQDKEAIANRWNVGAVAAPVFYGDFGGSGIDPQFKDNAKSSDANLSYGVQVSYAVTPKFKVRTGVSNVDLNYNTQDISFSPSNSARTLRGIDFSQNASFLDITDRVNPSSASPDALEDGLGQGGNTVSSGEIQQNVGYIEIPLEAIYVLSDKRLGVEVIGGVSTLVLNNNEVFLESNGLRTNLGTSNALNDVSFTTNIGVGLNYKVTEKVKINIEPSLKYQLNAYNNSVGDFKPYYVGLYTGVNYRF
jgi:hypothetical protein